MNLIRPSIFSGLPHINAVFTEANRNFDANQTLNFGLNTLAKKAEIDESYNRLLKYLDSNVRSIALANQVHGSNIEYVDKPGVYNDVDALMTNKPGLPLGIQVADCAAVLIADGKNSIIGAIHAGWRGAVADIVPAGLKEMESLGGEVKHFKAYISPCISKEKFEVGEEVASQFPDTFVDRSGNKKPHVDLKGFLTHQMIECGMKVNQIEISPECTMQTDRFFSYRREQEKAGRMLGLIVLN